jgi:hypothetical protein
MALCLLKPSQADGTESTVLRSVKSLVPIMGTYYVTL